MSNEKAKEQEGPTVIRKLHCYGCKYHSQEYYSYQDDWGFDHYCNNPQVGDKISIKSAESTPDFCPFKKEIYHPINGLSLQRELEDACKSIDPSHTKETCFIDGGLFVWQRLGELLTNNQQRDE